VSGLSDALTAIAASIGVIVTIWGRVRAPPLYHQNPAVMVASALLVCAALALPPCFSACATARADTRHRPFTIQADYTRPDRGCLITAPMPTGGCRRAIRTAVAADYDALTAPRDAVRRGDNRQSLRHPGRQARGDCLVKFFRKMAS
jgi:hypothetical protein